MARSGLMDNRADPTGAPTYPTGGLSDVLSATMLAFGVLGAFLTRVRHGDAPTVDAAQLSALLWLQDLTLTTLLNTGRLV